MIGEREIAAMLAALGVVYEIEGYEKGARITLFMPTGTAFAAAATAVALPTRKTCLKIYGIILWWDGLL